MPGLQPGPPDKGRAVIYSGRCALLGVVGESGGGARPLRGTDHSAGPRRGVLEVGHSRPPGFDQGASGPKKASRIWAPGLGFLPSPHPPTASAEKEEGVEGKATPLAAGSVRAPGARGGRAPRGPAEAAACVVLFLDSFQLWGKKTFVSRYKKKRGGRWGGLKKIVKPKLERVFAK